MNNFFKGKKVFVTGHTGFKGSYLSYILLMLGAEVKGYSLDPPTKTNLYDLLQLKGKMHSVIADITDVDRLTKEVTDFRPDLVFHLAAQPLVLDGYRFPRLTYETNVMGTVNILESIRNCDSVRSFLNVTTDKVYNNFEWEWGYRETDPLDGYDPYSNSKSCSELVTHSYKKSFFDNSDTAISTARAGNVIGGGDFADNRIIPDCIRAVIAKKPIIVRNPNSIRPYQHVLEPLSAYLKIIEAQAKDSSLAGSYNVGPQEGDCVTTGTLVKAFCDCWGGATWECTEKDGPHEANFLKLDCSLIRSKLGWAPKWNYLTAIEKTVEWAKIWSEGHDVRECVEQQIKSYFDNE